MDSKADKGVVSPASGGGGSQPGGGLIKASISLKTLTPHPSQRADRDPRLPFSPGSSWKAGAFPVWEEEIPTERTVH